MKYNKYKLDNSILFDVYTYPKNSNSLQDYIHNFTESIILTAAIEKSGRNYEHHVNSIKQLCLNSVVSIIAQRPIAISLNKNDYSTGERLKKLFMSYEHHTKIFHLLVTLKYLELKKGSTLHQKVTRFWPSEKFVKELLPYITNPPVKAKIDEYIFLRPKRAYKKAKAFIEIKESEHKEYNEINNDIRIINDKLKNHKIEFDMNSEVVPTHFLDYLSTYRMNGVINIKDYDCHYRILRSVTDNINENVNDDLNYKYEYSNFNLINSTRKNTILNNLTLEPLKSIFGNSKIENKKYFNYNIIADIVNKTLKLIYEKGGQDYYYLNKLSFEFNYNELKRIFSENLDLCGRFNHPYQLIPSFLRKYIKIDGEETVEVDIKACTLQMLYHISGNECPDNPYDLETEKEENAKQETTIKDYLKNLMPIKEKIKKYAGEANFVFPVTFSYCSKGIYQEKLKMYYKFIQIVIANAMDKYDNTKIDSDILELDIKKIRKTGKIISAEESAIKAIHHKLLEDEHLNISFEEIKRIIDKFKEKHFLVRSNLFTGVGRKLQNIESRIANKVLLHFAEKDIMCMCIHDSFRIGKSKKDELIEVLKNEYFKEFGYYPALTVEE